MKEGKYFVHSNLRKMLVADGVIAVVVFDCAAYGTISVSRRKGKHQDITNFTNRSLSQKKNQYI
jgi:hypothetical protein